MTRSEGRSRRSSRRTSNKDDASNKGNNNNDDDGDNDNNNESNRPSAAAGSRKKKRKLNASSSASSVQRRRTSSSSTRGQAAAAASRSDNAAAAMADAAFSTLVRQNRLGNNNAGTSQSAAAAAANAASFLLNNSRNQQLPSNNNPSANQQQQPNVLDVLCEMLLQGAPPDQGQPPPAAAAAAGGVVYPPIDLQKAQNVLEAAAGNLALAANLYWDDYLAQQQHHNPLPQQQQQQQQQGPFPPYVPQQQREDPYLVARAAAALPLPQAQANAAIANAQPKPPPARRGRRQAAGNNNNGPSMDDIVDSVVANARRRDLRGNRRGQQQQQQQPNRNNNDPPGHNYAAMDVEAALAALPYHPDHDDDDVEESDDSSRGNRQNNDRLERGSRRLIRRVRRSLDPAFQAADNDEAPDPDDEFESYSSDSDPLQHLDYSHNDEETADYRDLNDLEEEEDHQEEENARRLRRRQARDNLMRLRDQDEASISVSDDEIAAARAGLSRSNRRAVDRAIRNEASLERKIREAARKISKKVLKGRNETPISGRKRKRGNGNGDDDSDDSEQEVDDPLGQDPDDYISDRDWLDEEEDTPVESLWGSNSSSSTSPSASNNNGNNRNDDDNNSGNHSSRANNVVMMDEDDDEDDDDRQNEAVNVGIPHTWLHAGFNLSECGTGLIVKAPKTEEIDFYSWRQQQNAGRRNAVPPPYHCKSVTSILSIVTALLYTGASIQGNEVNCTSGKKPWAELTAEERKREFEDRLADALSSLIFIAAKTSRNRKEKAYRNIQRRAKKRKHNSIPIEEEVARERKMQMRLNLVPTCIWVDALPATLVAPDDALYCQVKLKTSLTNIRDIKCFVLSCIRSFTSKGGVALLLETIIRIHGNRVVARQIKKARELTAQDEEKQKEKESENTSSAAAASSSNKPRSRCLLRCKCEDKQKEIFGTKPLPASLRSDPEKLLNKLTPPGADCVSVELMTLLLSGQVQPTWQNCAVNGMGFGLLTESIGIGGFSLARPEKPVWLLKGESCYSVLILENNMDIDHKTISRVDKPGTSMFFCHWNTWYGETNKSGMRLITASTGESPSKKLQQLKQLVHQIRFEVLRPLERLSMERSRTNLINEVAKDQHESIAAEETKNVIGEDELERVKAHPEDQKLYPSKYQMWRFDIEEDDGIEDRKQRAEYWTPYHRLNAREKKMVERKLGPKINKILWSRWPDATIDNFIPDDGKYPIV